MSQLSINQIYTLFQNIANAHEQINDFHFGSVWTIEEKMNKEAKYPLMCVAPISSTTQEQVKERSFEIMIFDINNKDKTNLIEIWSDTEQILDDVIKILRRESANYEVVGDPQLIPEDEKHTDWVSGYRSEVVIRTDFNSNHCDVPASSFISPETPVFATVVDQNGNVLMNLYSGDSYQVIVASGILDDLNATVTVIDQL